jgi:hypothetical protein
MQCRAEVHAPRVARDLSLAHDFAFEHCADKQHLAGPLDRAIRAHAAHSMSLA